MPAYLNPASLQSDSVPVISCKYSCYCRNCRAWGIGRLNHGSLHGWWWWRWRGGGAHFLPPLLRRPLRMSVWGAGGTGKSLCGAMILRALFGFFLGNAYTQELLAPTNRAASLLGTGANTMHGFGGSMGGFGDREDAFGEKVKRGAGSGVGAGAAPALRCRANRGASCVGLGICDEFGLAPCTGC